MRWAAYIGGGFLALWIIKAMTRPKLDHFTALEFGVWWPVMSKELLISLDQFREMWGAPVSITSAVGGIGREDESGSQHNILKWGEVRAVDIIPSGMNTATDRRKAVQIARQVGFTGIGLYPEWKPSGGLHLDVRQDRTSNNPATWSRIEIAGKQEYVELERGFA